MGWRYYAQRATTGEWLDTNVQMSDEAMSWILSSPNVGQARLPVGIGNQKMQDGRPLFGKFDTILLVEDENDELIWFGICTEANPVANGTALEFIGFTGWLAGVPYTGEYQTWQRPLFDVMKEVLSPIYSSKIRPQFNFKIEFYGGQSLVIGDPQPPARPELIERPADWSDETWKQYSEDTANHQKAWQENHGWKQQYELLWWEAPMVGKEIDDLVAAYNVNYVESVQWTDRSKLKYLVTVAFDDGTRVFGRTDIEFVDGVNLAKPIDIKPGNARFANRVIGLGSGEGRDMLRVDIGGDDGRMYQVEIIQYKAINNTNLLRNMAQNDLKYLRSDGVKIETLTVWDREGYAEISTLVPGQEIRIKSEHTVPPVDGFSRVRSITRVPNNAAAVVNFEVAR